MNAFLDEARIAARIAHPNVASIDDVVIDGNEVLLVMDYVHGAALSQLWEAARSSHGRAPLGIAVAIAVDLLHGLHAAHTARDERAQSLRLVHRDVSPQNVLVGVDGVARVLDFGIAKALGRLYTTTNGAVKGKLAYMAPERFLEEEVTASVDQYAAAIVLWELLAGDRYFGTSSSPVILPKVVAAEYRHLDDPELGAVDAVLERALNRKASDRFPDCSAFATALEGAAHLASRVEIAAWVQKLAGADIEQKARAIEIIEGTSVPSLPAVSPAFEASAATPRPVEEPAPLEKTKLSAQGAHEIRAGLPQARGQPAARSRPRHRIQPRALLRGVGANRERVGGVSRGGHRVQGDAARRLGSESAREGARPRGETQHRRRRAAARRPAGLRVTRDGREVVASELGVAIPLDPGAHEFQAAAPTGAKWSQRLELAAGEKKIVRIALTPGNAAKPTSTRAPSAPERPAPTDGGGSTGTWGLVVGGVGAAGVAFGAAAGLVAIERNNASKRDCPEDGPCRSPDALAANSAARDWATASTVAFAAGGALLAIAVIRWVTAGPSSDAARVAHTPRPRFDVTGVRGTF